MRRTGNVFCVPATAITGRRGGAMTWALASSLIVLLSVWRGSGRGDDCHALRRLLVAQLRAIERCVAPTLAQQLLMPARLRHGAVLDHENAVGIHHRVQPMGDDDGRAPPAKMLDCALHLPLRFRIERGGGF